MSDRDIYVARLLRLPLVGADGSPIGRLADVVVAPSGPNDPPRVLGFVVEVQRRHIFVNASRVAEIDASGARMASVTLDYRPFQKRPGELLVRRDVLDRQVGGEVVYDVALRPSAGAARSWYVALVALNAGSLLRRRRAGRVVPWTEVRSLFDAGPVAREVVKLRGLHPADVARTIARLPQERRQALAEAMDDERLADLLEEMPEEEQVRLIESLDVERAADILEEMEPDDAVDLLEEMTAAERNQLLEAMQPDEAMPLRRLLTYGANTAGGIMTPEPLIVVPETTVAQALARIRERDVPMAIAAHVFVVEPPTQTPTGRYIGPVGFQRLLREPPSTTVARCIDEGPEAIPPDLPEAAVASRLAAYDVVALPVCDKAGRLLGAVTVDDVLDHILPPDWRRR